MSEKPTVRPFKIEVDDATLDWIKTRVEMSRIIPDVLHPKGQEWSEGTPSSALEDLRAFWLTQYDWRKVEARLNETYTMFTADLDEGDETISLHFVHHQSPYPDAIPLLFPHGWPGNFTEVEKLLPLTNPTDSKQQAFHIVAPSLPGFAFSSSPKGPGFSIARIARLYHKLMLTLGYNHYVGQGGDWGSYILRSMALQYPEAVVGIHINFPICIPPSPLRHPLAFLQLALGLLSPAEKRIRDYQRMFIVKETGYSKIQCTKPQTISHALLDSPIGMLSWLMDKMVFAAGPDYVWDKEDTITWTMLYLISNSAGHARIYKAAAGTAGDLVDGRSTLVQEVLCHRISKKVAVGASFFPWDVGFSTRFTGRATLGKNITFWKIHDEGGHFASVTHPHLLMQDLLEFVQTIPPARRKLLWGQ